MGYEERVVRECLLHGLDRCSECAKTIGKRRGTSGGRVPANESLGDWGLRKMIATQDDGEVPESRRIRRHEIASLDTYADIDANPAIGSASFTHWRNTLTDAGIDGW